MELFKGLMPLIIAVFISTVSFAAPIDNRNLNNAETKGKDNTYNETKKDCRKKMDEEDSLKSYKENDSTASEVKQYLERDKEKYSGGGEKCPQGCPEPNF